MRRQLADRDTSTSRELYAFGITAFLNDTATEIAYWVLPAFLISIGAGPAQLGLIEGIAESVASAAKLFSGYLTDHIKHRKPVVVGGYFLANAVKPLLAIATSWWHVLLIRFSDRLSKGIRGTPRDIMVADLVPRNRLGSAYGLIQAMDSAGAILGPLIALLMLSHFGIRSVFLAAAVPGALCVLVAWLGIKETQPSPDAVQDASKNLSGAKVRAASGSAEAIPISLPANFYLVLIAVTLFSLGNSSDMFLVLRAQNLGIAVSFAPLLGLVFNITYTLASWPAGKLSDRVPRRFVAAAGYLIFAAVYFVFGRAPSKLAIWIAMASYGCYYALTDPVLKALVVAEVEKEIRGRALGIYFFVTSIATLAASLISGEIWKRYGAARPFYLSSGMALFAAILLLAGARSDITASRER